MKKLLTVIALGSALMAVNAQDTNGWISGPAWDGIKFLSSGSNWMAATYGIANVSQKEYGGGVALAYRVSDYVVPTMRLDYYSGSVWMPSASLQLQAPLQLLNKFTLIPFAFSGLATPIAGRGKDNLTAVGIFGVGGAVRIYGKWDLVGDYEYWSGFKGQQVRFGVLYRF